MMYYPVLVVVALLLSSIATVKAVPSAVALSFQWLLPYHRRLRPWKCLFGTA